ncbi:MAG: hypothetical protein U9Q67_00100 [Patescibacteria group bacterium]|nr:hypothetical protein [Patescibacteria group bacterium]
MFGRFFRSWSEQRGLNKTIETLAGARVYYEAISCHVGPGQERPYDEQARREFVTAYSLRWLTDYAREIFPGIDELVIEEGWVIYHPDHDQNATHKRFTLHQLWVWIDDQEH